MSLSIGYWSVHGVIICPQNLIQGEMGPVSQLCASALSAEHGGTVLYKITLQIN